MSRYCKHGAMASDCADPDCNPKTPSGGCGAMPLLGVGEDGFWCDADIRNPGHLRLRKMTVTEVFEPTGKYEIQSEGYPYLVPFSACFKTVDIRSISPPNVKEHQSLTGRRTSMTG